MSAPVHRDDETDDFRFYAPPHVRERATASDPDTQPVNSPAIQSASGDTEAQPTSASSEATEGIVSAPEPIPELLADWPAVSRRPEAPSSPRMAPGVGGPNIHSPPASCTNSGRRREASAQVCPHSNCLRTSGRRRCVVVPLKAMWRLRHCAIGCRSIRSLCPHLLSACKGGASCLG